MAELPGGGGFQVDGGAAPDANVETSGNGVGVVEFFPSGSPVYPDLNDARSAGKGPEEITVPPVATFKSGTPRYPTGNASRPLGRYAAPNTSFVF